MLIAAYTQGEGTIMTLAWSEVGQIIACILAALIIATREHNGIKYFTNMPWRFTQDHSELSTDAQPTLDLHQSKRSRHNAD